MWLLVLIIAAISAYTFIPFRLFLQHPVKTIRFGVVDAWEYFYYRKYDIYNGGTLNCYFAHFGGGKTLSVVHCVTALYRRYNNKKVWDRDRKQFVVQKVHVLSNVHITGIPYEDISSLSQIVCYAWRNKDIDKKQNTRTVVLVLLDELSSEMNSRNFRTNIDADFLNTLITSRHFNMSIFYTSQKFKLVDALLRSVTQRCIWCNKVWRMMVWHYYDADEMEYTSNPALVKPIVRTGFFISDNDYAAYDTSATVGRLKKAVDANEMLTEDEIIKYRGDLNPDNNNITQPSKKMKRLLKKR